MFLWQDWTVIIIYLLAVLVIGTITAKQKNLTDFLFASGKLSWWAVGISLIATSVSSTSFIGSPAEAYKNGFALLMLNISVPLSLAIVWIAFIPWFRKNKVNSAYQLIENSFGKKSRLFAAGVYSFHLLLRAGILIYGPAIVLARFLDIPIYICLLFVGVVAIIYSYLGGIKAIVWTDVLQFATLFVGAIVIAIKLHSIGDGFTNLWNMAESAGKTKIFNLDLDPSSSRTFISAVIAYFVFDLAIRSSDQQFIQRYMSCKSVKEAQLSALLSVLLGFVISLGFFTIGAMLWSWCQTYGHCPKNANDIIPYFVIKNLSGGGAGLVLAGVFAAAMSSLDSAISSLTNTALIDIVPILNKKQPNMDKTGLKQARFWTIFFGILALAISFYVATSTDSLLESALSLAAIFPGVLFALITSARLGIKISDKEALLSVIAGLISIAVFKIAFPTLLAWTWWPLLSFSVSMLCMILISTFKTIIRI